MGIKILWLTNSESAFRFGLLFGSGLSVYVWIIWGLGGTPEWILWVRYLVQGIYAIVAMFYFAILFGFLSGMVIEFINMLRYSPLKIQSNDN